jgi:hypothetical protein
MSNLKRIPLRRTLSMKEIIQKNTDKTRIYGKTRNGLKTNIQLLATNLNLISLKK